MRINYCSRICSKAEEIREYRKAKKLKSYLTGLISNHFHILIRMFPDHKFTDEDIQKRYESFYGDDRIFAAGWIPSLREKLSNLSEFVREIKVGFARYYNRRHNRRGYFWGDRFKSVIVENGETLINCLAYIDLNPLRAGLVELPEEYRWNSLGYHIQTGNKDNFLSTDFGPVKCASLSLRELHRAGLKEFNVKSTKERIRRYRRYVYEVGALDHPGRGQAGVIENVIVEHEREKKFRLNRVLQFRYGTRYFTDSGVIGTKKFVSQNYQRFKDVFMSRREEVPRQVAGLDGIYSLKRLAE